MRTEEARAQGSEKLLAALACGFTARAFGARVFRSWPRPATDNSHPAISIRLQILQRVRRFGGVSVRVHGDVADKLLADCGGGESSEIESLVGEGLGKTCS